MGRGGSSDHRLLSNFQHQVDGAGPNLTQTELYTAYATRFSTLIPDGESDDREGDAHGTRNGQAHEHVQDTEHDVQHPDDHDFGDMDDINAFLPSPPIPTRLLNPVELISLTRMTFPKAEPAVDEEGRFVIRGLERRIPEPSVRKDMFPFALASQPSPSDPNHPFTNILKRKLALLDPEPNKRAPGGIGVNIGVKVEPELTEEDRELVDGLKRFRGSKLGKEVRDACVQQ